MLLLMLPVFTGCGKKPLDMPYSSLPEGASFRISFSHPYMAEGFCNDICVVEKEEKGFASGYDEDSYAAAALFDAGHSRTLYSEAAFRRLYPASMTKVMTAIVAMQHLRKEDVITCGPNVKITESGAQLAGFESGDSMTADQAMHALLMYSANDAAVAIAEAVGGSVEGFADMMNREAAALGAQGTHFVNPHGLHDEDHYTTAYDMYLMMNEAVKYDWFNEIISAQSYTCPYTAADGSAREMDLATTNLFLKGDAFPPEGITVIGGKTGTTIAAGNNLVLYTKDKSGNPYISVVMRAKERGILYALTTALLERI